MAEPKPPKAPDTQAPASTKRVLTLLFFGVLMGALDIAIVGPALPALRQYFGIGERAASWIFTVFVLLNLVGTPIMAKLSDVWGRRWVYVADVLLFGVGSAIVAAAPNYTVLLVGRGVQGLGAGGIFPVASAVIGDTFPPEKRGGALGLIGAVFGIAFLIGPIIGGVLLLLGWRWLFVINIPVAAILAVMSARVLPSTTAEEKQPLDVAGIIVLGIGLTALTLGVSAIDASHLWQSLARPEVWPLLAGAVVFLVAFLPVERRAKDPVLRPGLLNSRQVALVAVFAAGAGLGEAGMVFLPGFAVHSLGVGHSAAAFMLLPVVVAMGFGSPVVGRLLDKIGSKPVILTGLVILTAGLWILARFAGHLALFYVAEVLIGFGLASLLGAPLRYILLAEAPAEERGAGQALITVFTGVGQVVSAALIGAVVASSGGGTEGYQHAFMVILVVAGVMAVLALGLKGRQRELEAVRAAHAREGHGDTGDAAAEPPAQEAHA